MEVVVVEVVVEVVVVGVVVEVVDEDVVVVVDVVSVSASAMRVAHLLWYSPKMPVDPSSNMNCPVLPFFFSFFFA